MPGRAAVALLGLVGLVLWPSSGSRATREETTLIVVPVKWCIVEDRPGPPFAGPHLPPDGRFDAAERNHALGHKSLIWLQDGMVFVPEGRPVFVADPDPPTPARRGNGERRGDVNGTGTAAGQREREAVRRACEEAIERAGDEPTEKVVEILIRWFVDGNGRRLDGRGGRDNLWGITPRPRCSQHDAPPRKAMVRDPEAHESTEPLDSEEPLRDPTLDTDGDGEVSNFPETLAHENGHALCLAHRNPGLMNDTGTFGDLAIDPTDSLDAREEAQKLSHVKELGDDGRPLALPLQVSRERLDPLGEAPGPVDLGYVVAVTGFDGGPRAEAGLAGTVPRRPRAAREFHFLWDADADRSTGGRPRPWFPQPVEGIDLWGLVRVDAEGTDVRVRAFRGGRFVRVADPGIEGGVRRVRELGSGSAPLGARDAVVLRVPEEVLRVPLADGYRLTVFSARRDTGALDRAGVRGSTDQFQHRQTLQVNPRQAPPGDQVLVVGSGFTPCRIRIYFGARLVRTLVPHEDGSFRAQVQVPGPDAETAASDHQGRLGSPVMAVDCRSLAQATELVVALL